MPSQLPSRQRAPFDPAADADPRGRSRPRDPGAVDVAPDDVSLLGRHRPRSPEELADYGYTGQGYPLYGQPRETEGEAERRAPIRSAPYASRAAPYQRNAGDEPNLQRQPWLADPASSAFAFGYTTSLGAGNAPPSSRRHGNAGKGPRDYVRADGRIREDVCDRLSDDDAVDASEISVDVSVGEVTLSGTVLDRYSKRRAEDIAASVRGVLDVRNRLSVHKGLLRELGDAIGGSADEGHQGHHGSGTRQGG